MRDTESTITANPDAPIAVRPVYSASMVTAAGDTLGVVTLSPKRVQVVIVHPSGTALTIDLTQADTDFFRSLLFAAGNATELPQAKRA